MPPASPAPAQTNGRFHLAYVFERFPTFTQTFCVREIQELMRQGIRPLIFSLHRTDDEMGQSYPEEIRELVVYLPEREALTNTVRGWRKENKVPKPVDYTLRFWKDQKDKRRVYEAAWIGDYLRTHAPSIRHVHCHFGGMAARTLWWLRHFIGVTYSFTAHANDMFAPPPESLVTRQMLMEDASTVITVSDFSVRRLASEYPNAAAKIQRVYNGLDFAKWFETAQGKPEGIGSRRIYSVGRLIEKKGYPDLIKACGILRDRGEAFSCHIVGDGPMEDELREQIQALQLQDQVILEGPMDQDTIMEHLSKRAHLFALACVTEADGGMDNLPTVIMEAMAVGLPCVSTRLAGVPEMVIEEKTGLLTDEGEPEAFADCLAEILSSEAKARAYGEAGSKLALERFDQKVTAGQLKRELIAGGLIRFDPKLVSAESNLLKDYLLQLPLRVKELIPPHLRFSPKEMLEEEPEG